MLGAIIGDIAGSRFEFDNHRSKDFELFSPQCFVTDDSIMTLAVAKAIMETERMKLTVQGAGTRDSAYCDLLADMAAKYMREIGREYPHCGYGGMFARWMFSDNPEPYNSFGNGAAMRISPAGWAARTEKEARKLSAAITSITHNHPEGIKGAEAVTLAIFMARQGAAKDEIRQMINTGFYPLDFSIDEIRPIYQFNETCQNTVPQAIQSFLEASSFEDTIRTAVSLGGDSDTLAAIAGSIAEAHYGIPADIKEKVLTYLDARLRSVYDEWLVFSGNNKAAA